jgi:hypothetical protein
MKGPIEPFVDTLETPEDDPRDIPWIASWSAADRAARQGQNCTPTYTESGPDGTHILTTSKSCESGMPHTRIGDRIIIPDSVLLTDRHDTIRHEMIHIYQRRHARKWLDFYRRAWAFECQATPPAGMPKDIQYARRSNPDTWDPEMGGPWACWKGRYWPVAVYTDPQQPSLRSAKTIWWDSQEHTVLTAPPSVWTAFFGHPAQNEHPHEIAATLLVAEDTSSEAGRRIMNWNPYRSSMHLLDTGSV